MADGATAAPGVARIVRAIESLPTGRYLLAVSGGSDSMVLLDAFTRFRSDAAAVATFDHRTGPAARRAASLTRVEGERRGLIVYSGRRRRGGRATEAAWREARQAFLRARALSTNSTIVTAHTRDDQLETVVMRALRDARQTSARGLAAMYAYNRRETVVRPLLDISRADVASYARLRAIPYVEDPTNADRNYLRNRLRLDLLPAIERVSPGFSESVLRLSRAAADWRASVDEIADCLGALLLPNGALVVPSDALRSFDDASLAILWPALAERAGVVLDRRGTERLIAFTNHGGPAGHVPLAGGARAERNAATFVIRASGARE